MGVHFDGLDHAVRLTPRHFGQAASGVLESELHVLPGVMS